MPSPIELLEFGDRDADIVLNMDEDVEVHTDMGSIEEYLTELNIHLRRPVIPQPVVNPLPALTPFALTVRVNNNSRDHQRTTDSIPNSEDRPVTEILDRNITPRGATGFTPNQTIYYGSAPKEKQSQERQPKTTNEVASQQAENAPQLDDQVIDTGGIVASGGGATLSDQKSEIPRGKIKQPGKCTAWNGKLCQCAICKGKTVVLCQCGDKSYRNDLDICSDCGHTIAK
ncbi:hypothetical protein Bpfe_027499 [Biomphalaria pfeifferi]|uniref:Uncharacterized protein n=1 Tax=Biomphalaria pfeifferi TaxID=112525 RepID=A0AAD8AVC5_BIOPF|nr:hypothetical protein Bpfe_027499 [Biomphalaria pfeifferi]